VVVANKARAGIKWGAFSKIVNQGLSWLVTIWVIRLLTPEDFALIALSDLAIGVLLIVGQFGIGAALVRAVELTTKQINQSFSALIVANISLFLVFQMIAPYLADFFEQEKLTALIRLSAIAFLAVPFTTISSALLNRKMLYKQLYLVDMGISLLQITTNLTLAFMGYGFWALAVGGVVAQVARAISYSWLTKFTPKLDVSFSEFKPLLKDSGLNFSHSTAWEINQRLDTFFINLFIGIYALGVYRVVLSLAEKPVTMVGQLVQQIGLASFSSVSKNKALVGSYVVKSTSMMAFILFPVFLGIASVAPTLVPLLLGEKWLDAIVPLQIICCVQLVNALRVIPGSALFATGFGKRKLLHVAIASIASLLGWGIGLQYGLNIGCMLFTCCYVVWFIWHIWDASNYILINQKEYWISLLIPLFVSVIMFIVVTAISNLLIGQPQVISFISQVAIGALTYGALSLTLFKKHSLGLFYLLKNSKN
jgi:O-antigen/teichoic acid export membrane protein